MRKILIIGSSFTIKETFSKKFINDQVNFCNFRDCWENRNLDFYDVIVLSGYHHIILQKSFSINHAEKKVIGSCYASIFVRNCVERLSDV